MREVFFLSNRTAITVENLGHSIMAQFPGHEYHFHTLPYIDNLARLEAALEQIATAGQRSGSPPIVFSTLLDPTLNQRLQDTKALVIDPLQHFLPQISDYLHVSPEYAVETHRRVNNEAYQGRINAIDFALKHDDGATTRGYAKAEVILIGVSRSGKTPTSLYLALQFGLRAANYPITEEDMDSEQLPKPLLAHRQRLFGLSIEAERLQQIRQERRPDSPYASLRQCRQEIDAVERIMQRNRIPFINVASMSIEEIAARIVQASGLHR